MEIINETLAKRNKENMSFSDYKKGSATEEFNLIVAEARIKIDNAKLKVSPEGQERLETLFDWYCSKYASWINKSNGNGANHVSVMISGGSNYNMKAHDRYMRRETTLWKEYEEFSNLDSRIHSLVVGDKIIKSDDVSATEKLAAKVEEMEKEHEEMNAANKHYRKYKTMRGYKTLTDENADRLDADIKSGYSWCQQPYPSFTLTNHNARLKAAKDRLAQLSKIKERDTKETVMNGVRVVENTEAVRIQLFFEGKPELEMRDKLKSNGFRWTPSIGAWQRQLNNSGIYAARRVLGIE
jgi:hypothetical protein